MWIIFDGLCLKDHNKGDKRTWSKSEKKTLLDLDYDDDIRILDESVSKMNELSEVLRVQALEQV